MRDFLIRMGMYRLDRRLKMALGIRKSLMSHPPYGEDAHRYVRGKVDAVRYGAIALAIHRIQAENVPGAIAELGVYEGELSEFLATVAPGRKLHLFDTFEGFPAEDLEAGETADERFTNTSVEQVRRRIGDCSNVVFHQGRFPDTAGPVRDETFAFVMLDMDKYKPTLAGLELFYPRMSRGGYLFLHDFNNPESDFAVSRAVDEFFRDKPELIIELPDAKGSALIRKI